METSIARESIPSQNKAAYIYILIDKRVMNSFAFGGMNRPQRGKNRLQVFKTCHLFVGVYRQASSSPSS